MANILCEESDESSDFVHSSDTLDGATTFFEESDESSNFDQSCDFPKEQS